MPLINTSGVGGGVGGGGVGQPTSRKTIGPGYTLIDADFVGSVILDYNNASDGTVTVPTGITNIEACTIIWSGNIGQPTIEGAIGVTLNTQDSKTKLRKAYSGANIIPSGLQDDVFDLLGDTDL